MTLSPAHTLEEVVAAGWAPSVLFLLRRLRSGEIKGRKVGREWRMSDSDIQAYIESLANKRERVSEPTRIGLSAASMRRRAG